jgi:acyl-CoA hydrolase
MALRSWHPKADVSTIVPLLDEPVTSFQHSAVITEQGVAEIHGYDEQSQARHLIECAAHPSVREELRRRRSPWVCCSDEGAGSQRRVEQPQALPARRRTTRW